MPRIAMFVSPHGFGHAARACAAASELAANCHDLHLDIFSTVPRWFFADSLELPFAFHEVDCDVGLVQRSPLLEDLEDTAAALERAPFRDRRAVAEIADRLQQLGVRLVIADISPLGLAAAGAAGVPSVLIENFTWDWIYDSYPDAPEGLRRAARAMGPLFAGADLRIQSEPLCATSPGAIIAPPIARHPRQPRVAVRHGLGIPAEAPMVVVSMGGVPWDSGTMRWPSGSGSPWIVVPGGSELGERPHDHVLLLPFRAEVFHPDLVAASDVVVSKLGYSTVAEAACAGTSLAYLTRPRFPESPVLERWVERNMTAAEISVQSLEDGSWLGVVEGLFERGARVPPIANGAADAASAIVDAFSELLR